MVEAPAVDRAGSGPPDVRPEPTLSRKALLQLALLGVIWGATFPVARVAIAQGAPPFLLVAVDFLLAAGAMAALSAAAREARPSRGTLATSALLGMLLIGGINLLLFWGIQFTTGGVASIVFATAPLLSLGAAALLGRREPISARSATALAIGLAGVVLLGVVTSGARVVTNPIGIVALAGGAACQGVGASLVARYRPHGESRWGQASQFAGGGVAGAIAWAVVGAPLAFPATGAVLASTLYVALLTGVVGYSLYFALIRGSGAVRANLVTYLNPLVALAVGVLALEEAISFAEVAGLLLVLAALVLLEARRRPRRTPAGDPRP